jgi:hypothetical protein
MAWFDAPPTIQQTKALAAGCVVITVPLQLGRER